MMSLVLSSACLFLIKIKLVILIAACISIHCFNFQLVNGTGSRTKRERYTGEHRTKNKEIGNSIRDLGLLSPVGWDEP